MSSILWQIICAVTCGFIVGALAIPLFRSSECRAKVRIKIKYLKEDLQPITKTDKGDWMDLRAAEDVIIHAGEYKLIPLGVAIELPEGYEALVAPRSSTFKNFGIIAANSIGIIDELYCGETDQWHFVAYALRDTFIHKNERICQFRIIEHQPEIEILAVDYLNHEPRGGIGSTGKI